MTHLSRRGRRRSGGPEVFYVDTAGSDAAAGTEAAPFATLAHAASLMQPSSTLLLKRGTTFNEAFTVPADGITLGAYGSGAKPKIDGTTVGIQGTDHHDVTIADLEIMGWTQRGVYNLRGHRWTIERCTIYGGSGTAATANMGVNIKADTGPYCEDCVVRDCTFGTIGAGGATDTQKTSIFFQGILAQGVIRFIAEDNTLTCVDAGGIRLDLGSGSTHNTGCIIRDNEIVDCRSGIQDHYSDDTIITGNTIRDGKGLGVASAFGSLRPQITRNRIFNLSGGPLLYNGFDISGGAASGLIANNTVYKVARHCLTFAQDNGGAGNGWVVRNNIFDASANVPAGPAGVDARRLPFGNRVPITCTHDHNLLRHFVDIPAELVTNGSFETVTGTSDDGVGDTFTGWTQAIGTSSRWESVTAADAAAPIVTGTKCLKMVYGSGAHNIFTLVNLLGGKTYRLTFKGKSAGGQINLAIFNQTTGFYLADDLVTWSSTSNFDIPTHRITAADVTTVTRTLDFTPYVSQSNYRIQFLGGAAGTAYLEDVSVQIIASADVISEGVGDGTLYTLAEYQAFSAQGDDTINADPLFVNTTTDFTLQAGSPAIDAGVVVAGVTDGYLGVAPDLGYAEKA